jgi:hypothetical protein
MDELKNALEINKEINNLWKLKDRLEGIPPRFRLIHERLELKKLNPISMHSEVKDKI